jgi:hypothetical protein
MAKRTEFDDHEFIIIPRETFRAAGRKRWLGVPKSERKKITSAMGKSAWAKLTPEQRSVEMKRRAALRDTKWTPEELSAEMKRRWKVRRRNAAKKHKKGDVE